MQKLLFVMMLSALLLTACAVSQEEVSEPMQQITESVSETVPEETKPLSKPDFSSAEEIETVSDEDLIAMYDYYISSHAGADDSEIDLFGYELNHESVQIIVLNYQNKDNLPEYIEEKLRQETDAEAINKGKKIGGSDTIYEFYDVNQIFCGENENYSEYSLSYTEIRKYLYHGEVTMQEFPRATRYVYLKTILYDDESSQYFYHGDMTCEAVQTALELFGLHRKIILFGTVTESENSFAYLCYTYDVIGGDYGINSSAQVKKRIITIDKETGSISNLGDGQPEEVIIRECEIPGTAYRYEEEGQTP